MYHIIVINYYISYYILKATKLPIPNIIILLLLLLVPNTNSIIVIELCNT